MTGPRRGALWPFAASVVAVALVAASILSADGASAGAGAPASATELLTEFAWSAPADLTGPFAVGIRIEVQEEAWCEHDVLAHGTRNRENPVEFWLMVEEFDPGGVEATISNSLTWTRTAQVHVGSTVDTRVLDEDTWNWAKAAGGGARTGGQLVLTVVAFDLGLFPGAGVESPLTIELSCEEPFRIVSWYEGHEGRSFTQGTLETGVGATVNTGSSSLRTSLADGLKEEFGTARVRLQMNFGPFRPADDYQGRLVLNHPDGSRSWDLSPLDRPRWISLDVDADPGTYELLLDWAGTNSFQHIPMGVLVGMDPVDPTLRV